MPEVIELQRVGCELGGSPLYASVLERVAADVASGGACAEVLAPYASAPPGDAVVLRLLAAVHGLVLEGRAPELAAHYPSVGGAPGPGVGAAFVATVAAHRDEVRTGIDRPNQTNEVGRSAVLLGGLLELASWGLPLRLLEVGASAGLNLNVDRYRYVDGGWAWGPADAGVRFEQPWDGPHRPPLDAPLSVVDRRGCDLRPLDVASTDDRRRLRALLWPDQPARRARLDAALEIGRSHPVTVDRADAAGWLRGQLADPAEGVTTVVLHSVMAQYLGPADREALVDAVRQAAAAATPSAPVAWLRMEPASGPLAELRLTGWPGRPGAPAGERRVLAHAHFHGPPVTWLAPSHTAL